MAEHMRAELVVDALEVALHRRRPGRGLITTPTVKLSRVCWSRAV
jgi:hypothetical protein